MMKKYICYLAIVLSLAIILCSCRKTENMPEKDSGGSTAPEIQIVYPEKDGKRVVMLDAGHGFRDIGCDTDLIEGTEADVTISVVKLLKESLENKGITVILTHDGETFPTAEEIKTLARKKGLEFKEEDIIDNDIFSAYERAIYASAIAEDEGIDLFLSLHVNSIDNNPDISQYEMYYYEDTAYAAAVNVLCESLEQKLDNKARIVGADYENSYIVTKLGSHPSLLFEMGYATNERDANNLNSITWRRSFAETLAKEIEAWISSFEDK